jgi:hypothetical protein
LVNAIFLRDLAPKLLTLSMRQSFSGWDETMFDQSLSREYWPALGVSLILQVLSCVVAAMVNDGGALLEIWWRAVATYWGGFIVVLVRRPDIPTRGDLFAIEWGVLCLFVITPVVSGVVWQLMGLIS